MAWLGAAGIASVLGVLVGAVVDVLVQLVKRVRGKQ
jgi:predicted DNA repair protein MutK